MVRPSQVEAIAATLFIFRHITAAALSCVPPMLSPLNPTEGQNSYISKSRTHHHRHHRRRFNMIAFLPGHDRSYHVNGQHRIGRTTPTSSAEFTSRERFSLTSRLFSSVNGDFEPASGRGGSSSKRRSQRKKSSSGSTKKNKSKPRSKSPSQTSLFATMSTAVCIIPPDDAWDTIQRARHLARDTSFYKWPPAIRLFHPFAPKHEIPSLVGKLAEWIEEEGERAMDRALSDIENSKRDSDEESFFSVASLLQPFEVTLDSITILPHWEILDARIEALEERMPQANLGETEEQKAWRRRRDEGLRLIEKEETKGKERKIEREKKRAVKAARAAGKSCVRNEGSNIEDMPVTEEDKDDEGDEDDEDVEKKRNSYNGPCVIYLSPSDESRISLEYFRETLCDELFPMYDEFSPSSSVSPYPEQLPRKAIMSKTKSSQDSNFRPLLPIGRFATVGEAVKIAKVLQKVWEPLTFNVTDVQFISREDEGAVMLNTAGVGFGNVPGKMDPSFWDIPEVRHRTKHGTLSSSNESTQRMALTSSGEVEDVSKQGVYGCDAMVMLLGEEPEEELMDEESSLSMLMDDEGGEEDGAGPVDHTRQKGKINYDEIFSTAEGEYQRLQALEESPFAVVGEEELMVSESDKKGIEDWLDDDDGLLYDEGATVVVGRTQFFMGAMREYVGMPASSTIDAKDRIMGGGISAVARRKGSVSRNSDSWEAGDYGKKESDFKF
mmetsp:Transcript_30108/g.62538  ORF Transcript_30108/g.62538 Transcript_30108/m.62538 type:complete len:723 (-) Transcript_30108:100-2268(-)